MPKARRMFVTLAISALAGYGGLCLLTWAFQDSLLYFPERTLRLTPSDMGMAYGDVEIPTEDGERLHGWVIPTHPDAPWVLFCHGNAGNLSHRLGHALVLRRMGINTLFFDYRGYGRSTGKPTEAGLGRDADAVWKFMVEDQGIPPGRIVVMGESLGGGVASGLATRAAPAGLVMESTFTSVPDVGAEVYPWLPVRPLSRNRFPNLERLRGLAVPKLLMHGPQDEIIPYHHGRDLFEAAAEPKEWADLPGGHNTGPLERGDDYAARLRDFILRVTGPPAPPAG